MVFYVFKMAVAIVFLCKNAVHRSNLNLVIFRPCSTVLPDVAKPTIRKPRRIQIRKTINYHQSKTDTWRILFAK